MPSPEQEKDALDFVTDAMCSTGFLQDITDFIFSPHRNSLTVGEFYDRWLAANKLPVPRVPFSLGAILGYLYCGLLFTKEHWYDLLPTQSFALVAPAWGLSEATFAYPAKSSPSFQDVMRRIRNALGHGDIRVNIPDHAADRMQIMRLVSISFFDRDIRNPNDTFETTLNLGQLAEVVKKFQSVIHEHVRSKG